MDLGRSSLSLAVRDIKASRAFYETLGFLVVDGQYQHGDTFELQPGQDWLILRNGSTVIGLFQGMFDRNILTFHPEDVRAVQKHLKRSGVTIDAEADEDTSGPATVMLADPDGNTVMLDES